jgi:predicted amidohydrolase
MMKVAAIQMDPILFDRKSNLEKIAALAHQASLQGARLAVYPECAVTGYALTPDEAAHIAEPIPGPTSDMFVKLCAETDLTIMVGMLESNKQGDLYNTAILVDPQGLRARYRKTHLPTLGVDRYVLPGEELQPPVDTSVGRASMLICYDLRFPEPSRVLALSGAQLILLSTAWPSAASLYPDFIVSTRAAENHIYVVAANRIGEERGTTYLGRSIITNPDGHVLAEAGNSEETILYAEIDPLESDQKHRVFKPGEYELNLFVDRRPRLYTPLVE